MMQVKSFKDKNKFKKLKTKLLKAKMIENKTIKKNSDEKLIYVADL